jgi:hypothetical protein
MRTFTIHLASMLLGPQVAAVYLYLPRSHLNPKSSPVQLVFGSNSHSVAPTMKLSRKAALASMIANIAIELACSSHIDRLEDAATLPTAELVPTRSFLRRANHKARWPRRSPSYPLRVTSHTLAAIHVKRESHPKDPCVISCLFRFHQSANRFSGEALDWM